MQGAALEAGVGYYPDVGASYFLSRLPGFFGYHLIDNSMNLILLEKSLYEVDVVEPNIIQGIISKYTQPVLLKEDSVLHR
ncbi:hypothetical protein ZIOFF_044208 [Zingiber officinale]|uniref:3-hydroxyisobutyryl-CoA hydrolase n=1 Tax=Zingiber officinale TaxID=94328 RepID=A0A8J5KX27_ZINOF|nr:hypothetical protein ZIOFF_044208 [Zingiber officinale]